MGLFTRKKDNDDNDSKTVVKTDAVDIEKKEAKDSMKDLYEQTSGKAVKKSEKEVKKTSGQAYRVLVRPLISEKATILSSENKYIFAISNSANKIAVKKAIEEIYGIIPIDVNIIRMEGKKTRRGRMTGKRKNWKKAIITLPKDKTINVYEGV